MRQEAEKIPDDSKIAVRFQILNFQLVQLGEKIRNIQKKVAQQDLDYDDEARINTDLESFSFTFDNFELAKILLQAEGDNKMFYELDTA